MAIERLNSRLRHWFARFRRRTCVVSKALEMVDATIALFLGKSTPEKVCQELTDAAATS